MEKKPVISFRLDDRNAAALKTYAKEAKISVAAMAERLVVEGLTNGGADTKVVREELRAAKTVVVRVKQRIAQVLADVIDEIDVDLK